jgi:hypothetical protein
MSDDIIGQIVIWVIGAALAGGLLAAIGYGLYCVGYDMWEARIAKKCPLLTITTWSVTMSGPSFFRYMYGQSDDEVPDAEQQAKKVYEDLIARKKEDIPFWYIDQPRSQTVLDLRHAYEIELSSRSHKVRVLPKGYSSKYRSVWS